MCLRISALAERPSRKCRRPSQIPRKGAFYNYVTIPVDFSKTGSCYLRPCFIPALSPEGRGEVPPDGGSSGAFLFVKSPITVTNVHPRVVFFFFLAFSSHPSKTDNSSRHSGPKCRQEKSYKKKLRTPLEIRPPKIYFDTSQLRIEVKTTRREKRDYFLTIKSPVLFTST